MKASSPHCVLIAVTLLPFIARSASRAGEPLIVAHRGASYDAPENTLSAFREAWRQGADGVEGDFRLTADGQVVCIHDADTQRVAGVKHVVAAATLQSLQSLDAGAWKDPKWRGERMPTLAEVLAIVPSDKLVFIELKIGAEIVPPMIQSIENSNVEPSQIVVISFHADAIAECERLRPDLKTQWLTDFKQQEDGAWRPSRESVAEMLRTSRADGLGSKANTQVVNQEFLRGLCAADHCEFGVWTVDDPAVARFYIDQGAWSITTNRPAWLREQLMNGRAE